MEHDAADFVRAGTKTLVEWAQAGDPLAFDALVGRYQDMAVGYAVALLHDPHQAEEATQEAFLETWRILPALRAPEAFPTYLRLALRKHCNRITRRKRLLTVPLDTVRDATGSSVCGDPSDMLMVRERQAIVRAAVRALPEPERVAVALFYIGQRPLKEVAAFLEVPVSTVKNRLYTARQRLRERIIETMGDVNATDTSAEAIGARRPSGDGQFRRRVLSRLMSDYGRQFRTDPRAADRSLLTRAHDELWKAVTEGVIDAETARLGVRLLIVTHNFGALPELMDRYLARPLSPAEEFWARYTRVRGLAVKGDCAATVESQRAFLTWTRENVPGDPPLRLSANEPFVPADDPAEEALSPDALPVFALGIPEIGECFAREGVFEEWLAAARDTLAAAPKTAANRIWRFYALRHVAGLLAQQGSLEKALEGLAPIRALSDEGNTEQDWQAPRWHIEALYLETQFRAEAKDATGMRAAADQAVRRLREFAAALEMDTPTRRDIARGLANNLAATLTRHGAFDLALSLWEWIAGDPLPNEWSYLWYAECVWATAKDRARTLALLRQAAARRFDEALRNYFTNEAAGFADVREDPELLAALTPSD